MRTRVWKGCKEFSTIPYFVGQVQGERDLYRAVTEEYDNLPNAEDALYDWMQAYSAGEELS